ncbi:MAG: PEP-CTERM sorting domain-containing protein [Cephaloticoccus sp.]|nr:PEP-CTERM sorting domain-containing protein [Cephaloticoccus sp.]
MKSNLQLLLCLFASIICVSSTQAQVNYDFDGTTTTYFSTHFEGIGQFTDGTLLNTYTTNGTSTSNDAAALFYNSTLALDSDWTVSLSFTAPTNLSGVTSLSSNETVAIGMSAERTGTSGGAFMDLMMQISNADGSGPNDRQYFAEYNDGFSGTYDATDTAGTTDTTATLSLMYDYNAGAGTGILTAWYGSTQIGGSYNLLDGTTGWNATTADTVSTYIFFQSANIDAFDPDRPQFTNYTVSAVPEPSTYAILAGLCAGVMVILRQRCQA